MKRNDAVIFDFFEKKGGNLLVVSDDPLFYRTVRALLGKALNVKRECIFHFQSIREVLAEIKRLCAEGAPLVVFIERLLKGASTAEFIGSVKKAYPHIKMIVLTGETEQERLVLLHELGADNFVTKPASVNDLMDKMAMCMQPQGKLGRMLQLGRQFLGKGDSEKALAVGRSILELKPGHAAAYMLCGEAQLRMGRKPEAVACFEEASRASAMYLEPLKRLADLFQEEDEDAHLACLKKLDQLSPLNTMRKTSIGKVYARKEEYGKAEHYFDQAVDLASREAMGLISKVVEEIADSVSAISPALAEKYLVEVLDLKGARLGREDIGAFNRLGLSLRRQGKWRQAVDYYRKALSIAEDDEGLHYNLGMAFLEGGMAQDALVAFRRALQLNPDLAGGSASICFNIAFAYAQNEQPEESLVYLKKTLELQPNHSQAQRLLDKLSSPGPVERR